MRLKLALKLSLPQLQAGNRVTWPYLQEAGELLILPLLHSENLESVRLILTELGQHNLELLALGSGELYTGKRSIAKLYYNEER